jgi:hypothetical protein
MINIRTRPFTCLSAISLGTVVLGFASSAMAAGGFTTLTLPTLTADIRTWTDGSAYNPLFPASGTIVQPLGGVPFQLQTDANDNTVFYGGNLQSPTPDSLTIPVGVFGVTKAYTLINTAFGALGANVGSVTFDGSAGDIFTVDLIEGSNVRDHYNGSFVNTTSDPTTLEAVFGDPSPGHAHLDMQTFTLPSNFAAETLTDIVFNSSGDGNPGDGKPFIAGATVFSGPSAVPENGQYCFFLGLLAVGAFKFCVSRREATAR